jgi:hypothetical protein
MTKDDIRLMNEALDREARFALIRRYPLVARLYDVVLDCVSTVVGDMKNTESVTPDRFRSGLLPHINRLERYPDMAIEIGVKLGQEDVRDLINELETGATTIYELEDIWRKIQ